MVDQERTRRVTASDIARSLGISRATVGFVLNDTPGQTISLVTREKVLAEATRLGYRPHLAARALASGQSKIILLVLPDWPIEYTLRIHLEEASHALDEAGYSLVTTTPHAGGRARPLWETLQPDLVMGLVPFSSEQAAIIRRSGARVLETAPPTRLSSTSELEIRHGSALQIQHLAERGHRRVCFASTTDTRLSELAHERENLAREAAAVLGLQFDVARIDEHDAGVAVASWTAGGVTAVAAYNDDLAAIVTGAALRQGLRVPEQLAVIGHDDAPIARLMVPSLSTVYLDTAGLGRYLAALALDAIDGVVRAAAPSPTTRAVVVVREST